jgi:hypothetical protein
VSETQYPAGQRPRIRVLQGVFDQTIGTRETSVLTRINSKTAYFRNRYIVGEMAADVDQVQIIRHADGTPVLETERWPPLTPYDTGERLQPEAWVLPDRRRPEEHDPDRYGKVDFNNDENNTDVTVWCERNREGMLIVHVLGHTTIAVVDIDSQMGGVPAVLLDGGTLEPSPYEEE